jgi:hypothetical protein
MNKGSQAPAPFAKPIHGATGAGAKVTGGDVKMPFAGAPKPGKMVKKGK